MSASKVTKGRRHQSGVTTGRVLYRRWRFLGFEYRSDLIAHDYMRRWVLFTPWGTIRLHNIRRSDSGHPHDHPMDFTSIILRGGYVEHRPGHTPRRCLPGRVIVRRAEDLHFLQLLGASAWTLVFAGLIRRDWGFQTEDEWIPAGKYDAWLIKRAGGG